MFQIWNMEVRHDPRFRAQTQQAPAPHCRWSYRPLLQPQSMFFLLWGTPTASEAHRQLWPFVVKKSICDSRSDICSERWCPHRPKFPSAEGRGFPGYCAGGMGSRVQNFPQQRGGDFRDIVQGVREVECRIWGMPNFWQIGMLMLKPRT